MKRAFTIVVLSLAAQTQAQDTEVPHVFQAGTPARAAEVNANFAALTDGVNANAAALAGLLSAASPQEIGTLAIEMAPYTDQPIPIFSVAWSGTADLGGIGPVAATFGDMTVAKAFDLLSPQLLADYAALKAIPEVRIEMSLSNAMVSTYVLGTVYISGLGATTVDISGTPLETVRFFYERLTVSTTDQTTNTTTTYCWNIQTNAVC